MSKSRHTDGQIIASLKQVEAGRAVEDLARECGVSSATIHARFGAEQLHVGPSSLIDTLPRPERRYPGRIRNENAFLHGDRSGNSI